MRRRVQILKATNVFIWLVVAYLLTNIIVYFMPLNVSNLETRVDGTSYVAGDTITTTNMFESFRTAQSTYDNRIVCRNGVERRAFLNTIVANTTPREISQSLAEFTVPNNIEGDRCVIQNTATSCAQILPVINKCVTEITESNEFKILED